MPPFALSIMQIYSIHTLQTHPGTHRHFTLFIHFPNHSSSFTLDDHIYDGLCVETELILVQSGSREELKTDEEGVFASMRQHMTEVDPLYILYRAPSENKWQVIFYMPEKTMVRLKMIYAASANELKQCLGGSVFLDKDWRLAGADQCTYTDYKAHRLVDDGSNMMTLEERERMEGQKASAMEISSATITVQIDLPLKVADNTMQVLASFSEGKCTTAFLFLDRSTEELQVQESGHMSISQISNRLTKTQPNYILSKYTHIHNNQSVTKTILIYYCPDHAAPKDKMFYSASKSVLVSLLDQLSIAVDKNIETNAAREVSEQEILRDLYPTVIEKKMFGKPKLPGKKGKAKKKRTKFNAGL